MGWDLDSSVFLSLNFFWNLYEIVTKKYRGQNLSINWKSRNTYTFWSTHQTPSQARTGNSYFQLGLTGHRAGEVQALRELKRSTRFGKDPQGASQSLQRSLRQRRGGSGKMFDPQRTHSKLAHTHTRTHHTPDLFRQQLYCSMVCSRWRVASFTTHQVWGQLTTSWRCWSLTV